MTGSFILEGQAALNEINFLRNRSPSKKISEKILEKKYYTLKGYNAAKYLGSNILLNEVGLEHLREILYFIILNQPYNDIFENLGEYRLSQNFKKLIKFAHYIKKETSQYLKNEEAILTSIDKICKICQFENPFEFLSKTKEELVKNDLSFGYLSARSWVSQRFIEWQIENKVHAIYWPIGPQVLLDSVPILNLNFKNPPKDQKTDGTLNLMIGKKGDLENKLKLGNKNKEIDEKSIRHWIADAISEFHIQGIETYIINGLFEKTKIRCPYFLLSKPQLCDSCLKCSGYFPKIENDSDCPVVIIAKKMNLLNLII